MEGESEGDRESVNVFQIDETVYFKHYFEGEAVFGELRDYYNGQEYRFEVPINDFAQLTTYLRGHGYDLQQVDDITDFVVGVEQYTSHPENIFKASVFQAQTADYNCFLLKDKASVEEAVYTGAEKLTDIDIEWPF